MLLFSFSTVMMALLTSNIIVVLVTIPFLKKEFTPCFGYRFLFCFISLALLRLLLPFEFPFTTNVFLPQSISRITVFFQESRINDLGVNISLWNIFEIVWIAGIAVKLFRSVRNYRRVWNYISKNGIDKTADPKYKQILDDICHRHHKKIIFASWNYPCRLFLLYGMPRAPASYCPAPSIFRRINCSILCITKRCITSIMTF